MPPFGPIFTGKADLVRSGAEGNDEDAAELTLVDSLRFLRSIALELPPLEWLFPKLSKAAFLFRASFGGGVPIPRFRSLSRSFSRSGEVLERLSLLLPEWWWCFSPLLLGLFCRWWFSEWDFFFFEEDDDEEEVGPVGVGSSSLCRFWCGSMGESAGFLSEDSFRSLLLLFDDAGGADPLTGWRLGPLGLARPPNAIGRLFQEFGEKLEASMSRLAFIIALPAVEKKAQSIVSISLYHINKNNNNKRYLKTIFKLLFLEILKFKIRIRLTSQETTLHARVLNSVESCQHNSIDSIRFVVLLILFEREIFRHFLRWKRKTYENWVHPGRNQATAVQSMVVAVAWASSWPAAGVAVTKGVAARKTAGD